MLCLILCNQRWSKVFTNHRFLQKPVKTTRWNCSHVFYIILANLLPRILSPVLYSSRIVPGNLFRRDVFRRTFYPTRFKYSEAYPRDSRVGYAWHPRSTWLHGNKVVMATCKIKKNGHFEREEKNKMGQDYYSILELTKGASDADIKKS